MTAAVDFWLRWAEREGALHEPGADSNLVVLPVALQATLDLPEEVLVTADPEVAREEAGVLLAAGHPALDRATGEVLRRGDAGHVSLTAPGGAVPDAAALLDRARDAFPVDHGRIDPAGIPVRERVPVLRVGAQVSYAVGLDERFQERAEAWIEVPGRLSLPESAVAALVRCPREDTASAAGPPEGLMAALAAAHEHLATLAATRQTVLADDAATARGGELTRTREYYDAALAALDRRYRSADLAKRSMLEAKAEATRAERARRLAEVEEKFRPAHTIRPFRLHVLWVPALRLPCHVLRGRREFPLTLRWLRPARSFLPVTCPSCRARETLVAAKDRLGCRRCLPRAAVVPVLPSTRGAAPEPEAGSGPTARTSAAALPAPHPAARPPTPAPTAPRPAAAAARPASSTPARRRRRVSAGRSRPERSPESERRRLDAGNALAVRFWETAVAGDSRRLRRLIVGGSPAAAVHRLYGAAGPLWAIGCDPGDAHSLTTSTVPAGTLSATFGTVRGSRAAHEYTLRWELQEGRPAVHEVLPVVGAWGPRLPRLPGPQVPPPVVELDPVAATLRRAALRLGGLPLLARCLAAWWRVAEDDVPLPPGAAAAAAAILHQVGRHAGVLLTYAVVAQSCHAEEPMVRRAAAELKRALALSPERYW